MQECDIVMRGGVTSGVVYPLAIAELSEKYRFRNIGGTSVGAIGAAAAAAAEYRRRNSSNAGFEELRRLPEVLSQSGFIFDLFRPRPTTRALFNALVQLTRSTTHIGVLLRLITQLLLGYPLPAALGGLVGSVVPLAAWQLGGSSFWSAFGLGSPWVLGSAVAAAAAKARRALPRLLADHAFGLCSGYDPDARVGQPPLTNWLYGYLNFVADKKKNEPLTFGDLWGAALDESSGQRQINLEVMTTNLTHGRPHVMPFEPSDAMRFYFCPEEWKAYFPSEVMSHIVKNAAELKGNERVSTEEGLELRRLPEMRHLPIIVAVRMSLSFPVLFSAVPLWSVDYSLPRNRRPNEEPRAERCWFSDGGISMNFPLRLFDKVGGERPLFGLRTSAFPFLDVSDRDVSDIPLDPPQSKGPWLWERIGDLSGFVGSILDTMQDWRDNADAEQLGSRGGVVVIRQRGDEGGLNLDMSPATVVRLSERGRRARQILRDQFDWDERQKVARSDKPPRRV